MKISFITVNLFPNDAVGNDIRRRLELFVSLGHDCRAYVSDEHPAVREDCRSAAVVTSLPELLFETCFAEHLDPLVPDRFAHFSESGLLFFNYFGGSAIYSSIRIRHPGLKIFDYHGVTPPALVDNDAARPSYERGVRETALVRYADLAIARSEYMRDELARGFGFPKERIAVIPYAVDVERFAPGGRSPGLARRLGLRGGPVLLYVGRIAAHKRIDVLVRALPAVRREFPGTVLLLVGNTTVGVHRETMRKALALARDLGVGDAVIFAGEADHVSLGEYYNLCDAFVVASEHEGFCIPVIEAMACGKPVIGARSTALPSTIGDAGLLFAPSDAGELAALAAGLLRSKAGKGGDASYDGLSRAALERARLFSADAYRRNHASFLADAVRRAEEKRARGTPAPAACPPFTTSLPDALDSLSAAAEVGVPYRDASTRRFVGGAVSAVRRAFTGHLRRYYLDLLCGRQTRFNRLALRGMRELAAALCILKERQDALSARVGDSGERARETRLR